jgi:murein DD-endopeptidase MepM/ murein hydrolase activator NlpD
MRRIKYYYDPKTLKYERYVKSNWETLLNILGVLSISTIISVFFLIIYGYFFESPNELLLKQENKELKVYYEMLENDVNRMNEMLGDLRQRDDNLYRVIFETEPVESAIALPNKNQSNIYRQIREKNLSVGELIITAHQKVNELKKQMYVQAVSYEEITEMAINKEIFWASIPAIQPISNKDLNRLASGFGIRLHPILKVRKMHTGIDFTAPKGTKVYATGDGVVKSVTTEFSGYGKFIEIDHGFGFVTRYAHLNAFNVKAGQKVKRGDIIGVVGNTGSSTAPHLHYEILREGKYINPVNYFFKDLKPEEYNKILEIASRDNQSLS